MPRMPAMQVVVKGLESEGVEVAFGIPAPPFCRCTRLSKEARSATSPSATKRAGRTPPTATLGSRGRSASPSAPQALVEVLIEREADAAMGPALDKVREFDNA